MTRGRGINDSRISTFVHVMPHCIPICSFLEDFTGVMKSSSEQHKDLRSSTMAQYAHSPLLYIYKDIYSLVCLSTWFVANVGVNCDRAHKIGKKAAEPIDVQWFSDVHLQRKGKVITLNSSLHTLKVSGATIDPNIWHRLPVVINDNPERESWFTYELSQEPRALFKQGQNAEISTWCYHQRWNGRNQLCSRKFIFCSWWRIPLAQSCLARFCYLCSEYVAFVIRHCGLKSLVMFDGYKSLHNTKFHEHW